VSTSPVNDPPCDLCGRQETLTRHHLLPRARHRSNRLKRQYPREEMKQRIAMLCDACHQKIHSLFTERELADQFNSIDVLRAEPRLQAFMKWVRKQKSGRRIRSHAPRSHG